MVKILLIMENFKNISGLELNAKKTQLMVVGSENYNVGDLICGIEVVDKVKILGISIDRKLKDLDANWEGVLAKISRLINFWNLQKLSISGRILVAKTYLLSQATFFLGSLQLKKSIGDRINELMAYFVKGRDRILARNRWFVDRALGGYGLIDVHSLNAVMKAMWINKWLINVESMDINGHRRIIDINKPVDQWGGKGQVSVRCDISTGKILKDCFI